MARAYSAGGSRQSAVLVATISLHAGLFVVIASSLGPGIKKVIEESGPIEVPLPQPKPEPRAEPGDPAPAEPYWMPVAEPVVQIPEFPDHQLEPAGRASVTDGSEGRVQIIPATGEYVAASLRTRPERINALIDSCYPAGSRRENEEGRAIAGIVIGPQGSVLSWRVAESSGFPRLDAAMDCVLRRLAFAPARRDGAAVESEVRLPIAFRLR